MLNPVGRASFSAENHRIMKTIRRNYASESSTCDQKQISIMTRAFRAEQVSTLHDPGGRVRDYIAQAMEKGEALETAHGIVKDGNIKVCFVRRQTNSPNNVVAIAG